MRQRRAILVTAVVLAGAAALAARPQAPAGGYDALTTLFREWRAFEAPRVTGGVPDYGAAAMSEKQRALPGWRARLDAIDPRAWPVAGQNDHALVGAEMAGLDFDLRVRRPWARDPSFYRVVHAAQSDTPAHEGVAVATALELWTYEFPVRGDRLGEVQRGLRAAAGLYEQARANLTGDGRDLWTAGIDTAREQVETLEALAVRLAAVQPELVPDARAAAEAARGFRGWLEAELPGKRGPSGVGIEHYDWYLKHVRLLPYTWADQVMIASRELGRARASLALEEARNASLPELVPVATAEEHTRRFNQAVTDYVAFLGRRVRTAKPYMDPALRARIGSFRATTPREFFSEVDYRDPIVMRTHGFHWIDLAQMASEPHQSPVRRGPLLHNIWADRSEGLATGMEELSMLAGVFDGSPRSRELIWILLAQRGARAMGDLMMHANRWTLDEAARFAVDNTPRGWLRIDGATVWGEQQLYLQQPAYGTSYLVGKVQIDELMGEVAAARGAAFSLPAFMDEFQASGLIPVGLIREELLPAR
jgi:hypothetical protein